MYLNGEKKKVVMILTNGFNPDIRVYKEALYVAQKEYNVEILCWDREKKHQKDIEILNDKIEVRRFYKKSLYGSGTKQIFALLSFSKQCRKYLEDNNVNYEFLHCHDLDGVMAGYLIKKENTKLVFDMHEFYESRQYVKIKYIIRTIVNYFQSRCYKIIYVNEQQTIYMKEKNKKKLIYLPNYPEIGKFKGFRFIESDKLRISYTGYVRHLIPLENLMKATSGMENIEVAINGDGPIYEQLKELEKKYNNTKITGEFKHEDVKRFYENSDVVYVVYNKGNKNDETALPTKLYEAILAKTPLIVSEDSVMGNFVKENNIGFLVNGTDYNNIRDLLIKLQNNREILIEKRNNIQKIVDNYTWEEVVKNLDECY